jgi:hypothetical protein
MQISENGNRVAVEPLGPSRQFQRPPLHDETLGLDEGTIREPAHTNRT